MNEKEKIILINKFYKEFCFSNTIIACCVFKEERFVVIDKMLNGELEYSDIQLQLMLDFSYFAMNLTEVDLLNHFLSKLMQEKSHS